MKNRLSTTLAFIFGPVLILALLFGFGAGMLYVDKHPNIGNILAILGMIFIAGVIFSIVGNICKVIVYEIILELKKNEWLSNHKTTKTVAKSYGTRK